MRRVVLFLYQSICSSNYDQHCIIYVICREYIFYLSFSNRGFFPFALSRGLNLEFICLWMSTLVDFLSRLGGCIIWGRIDMSFNGSLMINIYRAFKSPRIFHQVALIVDWIETSFRLLPRVIISTITAAADDVDVSIGDWTRRIVDKKVVGCTIFLGWVKLRWLLMISSSAKSSASRHG